MQQPMDKKEQIKKELGPEAEQVLRWLDRQRPNFKSSEDICNYLMKHKDALNLLIEYRNLTHMEYDPFWPKNPYFGRSKNDVYLLDEQEIGFAEDSWSKQWEYAREHHYEQSTNVLYDKRYIQDFIKCGKYPIIGKISRKDFLIKMDQDLFRTSKWKNPDGGPQIKEKTHMQTMYAQAKDGKLYRFMYVIKIVNTTEDSGTMKSIPTFDFSVSVKLMPDDDLNHATNILRFDSQKSGHRNILGHGADELAPAEASNRFARERLYKHDSYDGPHFHLFDAIDGLVYVGRPLSSNVVTIQQLRNILTKEYRDTSAFNGMPARFIETPDMLYKIKNLMSSFKLSHNRLDGSFAKRKLAWHDQLSALRQVLNIIDNVLNVYPEKHLEEGREIMLGNVCLTNVAEESVSHRDVLEHMAKTQAMDSQEIELER